MNGATIFGILVLLFLAPAAGMVVGWTVVRARAGDRRPWRTALAVGASLFLFLSTLVVLGWAIPDAGDDLSAVERAALDSSLECGAMPFARVIAAERVDDRLRYTCGLTPFGIPRFSGEADCSDGSWRLSGAFQEQSGGDCGD
jgi:hypothetical protein